MKTKTITLYIVLIFAITISGCAAPTPSPTVAPTATPIPPTETAIPTEISIPTVMLTEVPSLTPTATTSPSPTLTATASFTPTPMIFFDGFRLNAAQKKPYGFLLIFILPGVVNPIQVSVDGKRFNCQVDIKLPDKLICTGPELWTEKEMPVVFYGPDDITPIYKSVVFISNKTINNYPEGINWNLCPNRATNVTCETENRVRFDPPCVVSTCFDACGYFYSIDTCKNSTPSKGFDVGN
jgi:hypothetical protein